MIRFKKGLVPSKVLEQIKEIDKEVANGELWQNQRTGEVFLLSKKEHDELCGDASKSHSPSP